MDDETLSHLEPMGSEHDDEMPTSPRGSFRGNVTLEDGELTVVSQDQSALQETHFSLNSFSPNSTQQQASQKRSYPASQLSIAAPSCFSVRDKEPFSKVAKVSGVSKDPFASALLAAKEEVKKHASKVTVVDEIPPSSGSTNTQYCMWNIDNDLKEIIDIYFCSCMEDKAHNELVKQFPKPDVLTLHAPELDKWLVLIQGKQSLASLRWEQDLQVTERNYMDAVGPLCILLQHLKKDPQAVQVSEATNLVLKSLSLLGHAVAPVNKHRRQDIVKSTHITDITEIGKHSDSMQKFLFGESKAKELKFVGELAETFPKPSSLRIRKTQAEIILVKATVHQTLKGTMTIPLTQPVRLLEIKAVKIFTRKSLTPSTGLFRGPPPKGSLTWGGEGDDQRSTPGVQQEVLASSQQGLHTRETEVSLLFTHSPFPLPFAYISLENIPRAGRLKYFLQNWKLLTDQWTLNTIRGYRLELTRSP